MLRRIRDLVLAGVVGGVLVLGGTALADIPDATPSVVDPTHTFYVCVRQGTTAIRAVNALDKSVGNCPAGWDEKQLAPVVPQTP